MLFAEKESNLINDFQMLDTKKIFLVHETDEVKNIVASILNPKIWRKWTDASAKNVPPPDFYCDELNLMMEVMRIDDHAREVNGKIYNPTNVRESKLQAEFLGLMNENKVHKCHQVIVNAVSGLPTPEDHNYGFYLKNFQRVIGNHVAKIPKYKTNHPNYKTIFLVFDESSEYVQVYSESLARQGVKQGQAFEIAKKHAHYIDKDFVDCFLNTDIDYLIWFAPYKCQFDENGYVYKDMPIITIYDVKNLCGIDFEKYDFQYMMSVEE